jgi:hypothetical protein
MLVVDGLRSFWKKLGGAFGRGDGDTLEYRNRNRHGEENIRHLTTNITSRIDGIVTEQQAARDQRERHESAKRKRELATIAAIAGTAIFALLTIIVTHVDTMRVIKAARAAATQQHDDTVVALRKTDAAVAESRRLADAANKSANLAEAAARAWVAAVRFEFAHSSDTAEPLKVRIATQNVGREPARALTHRLGSAYIESPSLPVAQWGDLPEFMSNASLELRALCKSVDVSPNYSVLYPNAYQYLLDIPITSTPFRVEDIKAKRAVYIVGGCFFYLSLGRRRYTTFCAFINPEGHADKFEEWTFSACPKGNDDYTEGER